MSPADRFRAGKRLWSEGDDEQLRKRYPNESTAALAVAMRRTVAAVYGRANILGLQKTEEYLASPAACRLRRGDNIGAAYRFTTGQVPPNKGLRRPGWNAGRMQETQFKKGRPPGNYQPVGSTRLVDGYLYRKISDTPHVTWTHNWIPEHRRVWEEKHGPVPPAHTLAFKNGDKTDVRLDNLELITRRELMARNTIHQLPKELVGVLQLIGAVNRQINRRTNANEKQD